MIAILQFDAVSLPHFHRFLEQGRLPAFAGLRGRGHWFSLDTPAATWEGSTYFSLYSGRGVAEHGIYFPFDLGQTWGYGSALPRHRSLRSQATEVD
jgi:hypothetical protein